MVDSEKFCPDAKRLLGITTICGKGCPIFSSCPRLILEDATDKGIDKAMIKIVELMHEKKPHGTDNLG